MMPYTPQNYFAFGGISKRRREVLAPNETAKGQTRGTGEFQGLREVIERRREREGRERSKK